MPLISFHIGHAHRTLPGLKGAHTESGSLRHDGTTVNGPVLKEIHLEALEAIVADAGFEHQMHCRSELAALCTRAMYGACLDTSHSLTVYVSRDSSGANLQRYTFKTCFSVA